MSAAGNGGGLVEIIIGRLLVVKRGEGYFLIVRERETLGNRSFVLAVSPPVPHVEGGNEVGKKYQIIGSISATEGWEGLQPARQICVVQGKGEREQRPFPSISFLPGRGKSVVLPLVTYSAKGPTLLDGYPNQGDSAEIWDVDDHMKVDVRVELKI